MNTKEAVQRLIAHETLAEADAYEAFCDLMGGAVPQELIAAFLSLLAYRGETPEELAGAARAMRERCIGIRPRVAGRLVDTCGTGGAAVKSFNVSTASMFVAAAAGVPVAKHGNRSMTRPSGSADVLTALGARIDLEPDEVARVIETVGCGFLFAPRHHPAIQHAMPARKALGVRTIFNLLGPLCNPANAQGQVLGVGDPRFLETMAHALARLGTEHSIVLHGSGLDEAALHGPTTGWEVRGTHVTPFAIDPAGMGYRMVSDPRTMGPLPPHESADVLRSILAGRHAGSRGDLVELNAGLALYVAGKASSIAQGASMARRILDSGKAAERLDAFVGATLARRELVAA